MNKEIDLDDWPTVMWMKQQPAFEMLTVYGWALLIISIVLAFMVVYLFSNPTQQIIGSACTIQPSFPCTETLLFTNSTVTRFVMVLTNNLGTSIIFPTSNAINLTTSGIGSLNTNSYFGSCNPTIALTGSQITCIVNITGSYKPSAGTVINDKFTFSYIACTSIVGTNCAYSSANGFKSTGFSQQSLSTSTVVLRKLNLVSPGGNIVINGVAYASGTSVYLLNNNYSVYALPSSWGKFSSWNLSNSNSPTSITSNTLQHTTLNLKSNANLTTIFLPQSTAQFNGASSVITVPNSLSLALGPGNFTLSAWIYPQGSTAAGCGDGYLIRIVGKKGIGAAAVGYSMYYEQGGSNAQKLFYSVADGSSAYERDAANAITLGRWHNVIMVANYSDPNRVISMWTG